jgi:hypothetical protein
MAFMPESHGIDATMQLFRDLALGKIKFQNTIIDHSDL